MREEDPRMENQMRESERREEGIITLVITTDHALDEQCLPKMLEGSKGGPGKGCSSF